MSEDIPTPTPALKPIHTIILDASPLLLNTPPLSTLLAKSTTLYTTPSVIAEIRDESARTRLETLYKPFLQIRSPKPESMAHVRNFAKKTGDAAVLSGVDLEVLALAYDLECERNGGNWRLRDGPGQKRVNGKAPAKEGEENNQESATDENEQSLTDEMADRSLKTEEQTDSGVTEDDTVAADLSTLTLDTEEPKESPLSEPEVAPELDPDVKDDEDAEDDSDGWITPSNLKRHQASEHKNLKGAAKSTQILQVATITGDFAMQNVLLQMNLNLLSPASCQRITNIKQTILRCHGCFATTKDMNKQFCPRCGNPTLTRVTCTTNDKGEVKLHLKSNMQWNNRGNVFSVPKPVSGSSNQKWQGLKHGGGKAGWGNGLILAEDQKEYTRALDVQRRSRPKDVMDEDYLPAILTGAREGGGGRVRVGAGRGVNSRKRG